MNKRILLTCYRRILAYYTKCKCRLERRLVKGTFAALTARKRQSLINRIARLQAKVKELQNQFSLATMGGTLLAAGLVTIDIEAKSQAIKPLGHEIRVSNNDPLSATVAMDEDGDFVAVWYENQDVNNDSQFESNIYARRYNSQGVALSDAFLVNSSTSGRPSSPVIAMDESGDFVIAWARDNGSILSDEVDIYARRFSSHGIAQGDEFRVNAITPGKQFYPTVAMDEDGDFIITWIDNSLSGGVCARRYNAQGIAQGTELLVATSVGSQAPPSVAMDEDGDFIISWYKDNDSSQYLYNADVYARRYNAQGIAQGGEFLVNTLTSGWQGRPVVAMDQDGNFVIVWQSDNGDTADTNNIFGKRYNRQGIEQGEQFSIVSTMGSQSNPAIAMDADGDFIVAWQSGDLNIDQIYNINAQLYTKQGIVQNSEFKVNANTGNIYSSSVAMDADGDFIVAWDMNEAIDARLFVHTNKESRVNTYTEDKQTAPVVAMDADGDYVVVWQGYQQDGDLQFETNIYAQRYNAEGNVQGGEFLVSTNSTGSQSNPSVAMDEDGDFVIVWQSNNSDIYARPYNAQGIAQGGEFLVNTNSTGGQQHPSVAMDQDGDFVIAWSGYVNLSEDDNYSYVGANIYARRYSAQSIAKDTQEFQVNTATGYLIVPSVAMDEDGDFVIAWQWSADRTFASVYAQRYSADGIKQGDELRVPASEGEQTAPVVAMDADGDFIVVWEHYSFLGGDDINTTSEVKAQRYTAASAKQGGEFNVNTTTAGEQHSPAIMMGKNGDFAITWTSNGQDGDGIDENNIYAKRYNSIGTAQGIEFKINSITTGNQSAPSIARDADGNFIVVWEHSVNNIDIYSKLFQIPTNITLSTNSIAENQNIGTVVGTITTTDLTPDDTFAYSLVSGDGSQDNASFEIAGNQLKAKNTFNFETKSSYNIRVRTTDAIGLVYEKSMVITVTDVNDAPTNLVFTGANLFENQPVGTSLGSFASVDPDAGDTHTYALTTGAGDTDNSSFIIEGNTLKSNALFNFEAKRNYFIRVETNDGKGGLFAKSFTINIVDINDTPTLVAIADLRIETASMEANVPLSGISSGGEINQVLTVSVYSDNPDLFSAIVVDYTSPNSTGSIRLTPVSGKSGTAIITVRVADNGGTANGAINFVEKSFRVTVAGIPQRPALLSVQTNEQNPRRQIDLVWSNVDNEIGYSIEVSQGDDTHFQKIEVGKGANDTTFSHTGLIPSTKYFYRIVAYNTAGNSPGSETIGANTADDIITSIQYDNRTSGISIYPNPTSGSLIIAIDGNTLPGEERYHLLLYTAQGKQIWSEHIQPSQKDIPLDLQHIPAGVYLLVIECKEKKTVKQLIKY